MQGLHYSFQTRDKLYFVLDYVNGGEVAMSMLNITAMKVVIIVLLHPQSIHVVKKLLCWRHAPFDYPSFTVKILQNVACWLEWLILYHWRLSCVEVLYI